MRWNFSLFGIPVSVQMWFWLIALFVSSSFAQYALIRMGVQQYVPLGSAMLLGVGCTFCSILFHEIGHAWTFMKFGGRPRIELNGLGGVATAVGTYERKESFMIAAAGPLFSLCIAGLSYVCLTAIPTLMPVGKFLFCFLFVTNVFWTALNLVPVMPLDGGRMLEAILGPKRERALWQVGLISAALMAGWALSKGQWIIAILFGFLAYQNFQRMQGRPTQRMF